MKRIFKCAFTLCLCGLLICGCAYNAYDIKKPQNDEKAKQASENEFYLPDGLSQIDEYSESQFLDGSDSLEFIPSDNYGELLVFAGGAQTYTSVTADEHQDDIYYYGPSQQMRYGLCTKDGTIVKQAIYTYIMNTRCGHYVLHYPLEISEGEDEYALHSKTDARTIIPYDGSWKVEIPQGDWQNGTFSGEFGDDGSFATYTRSKESADNIFTLYNSEGKATATVTGYDYISKFSCGLARGKRKGNGFSEYCYLDINGNVVLGPYTSASDFTEKGVAQVKISNRGNCLIDTSGNVITLFYASMSADTYDPTVKYPFCALSDDHTQRTYFERDGKQAFVLNTGDNVSVFGESDYITYRRYSTYNNFYRLADNSEIACSHCAHTAQDTIDGKYFIYHDRENNSACVFDYDGKHIVTLENYLWSEQIIEGTDIFIYAASDTDNPEKVYRALYDLADKKHIITFEDASYVQPAGGSYLKVVTSQGESMTPSAYIYDIQARSKLFENSLSVDTQQASDGAKYFSVYTNSHTRLYNQDMEQIMSFTNKNNV